jgi:hypothetical protein
LARPGVRGTFSQPGPSHPAAPGRLTRTLGLILFTMKISSLLLAPIALLLTAGAHAQMFELKVKAAVARTGSHFAETVVWHSPYSFNTALSQIPEQAAAVSRLVRNGSDTSIHPALPTRPLSEIFFSVATLPTDFGSTGRLELILKVDERGSVESISSTSASHSRLVRQYLSAFRRMKFVPGTCGGITCQTEFVYVAWFKRE